MNEPLLALNRRTRVAVAVSSRSGALEAPSLGTVFKLHELDALDGVRLDAKQLRIFAEVLAGRHIEHGGSTALTSDQWWQRWESVTEYLAR
jgi:hypothetical protein